MSQMRSRGNNISNDTLGLVYKFLAATDISQAAVTCKSWSSSAQVQHVLKQVVLNTTSIPKVENAVPETKWDEVYKEVIGREKVKIKLETQAKLIEKDSKDTAEMRESINRTSRYARYAPNYAGSYGVVRKDTCAAGCGCGAGCAAVTYVIGECFCPGFSVVSSLLTGTVGYLAGFFGRSKQIENRVDAFKSKEQEMRASLELPLIKIVTPSNK